MSTPIEFVPGQLVEVEESDVERSAADGRTTPRWSMDPEELRETYDRVRAYRAEKRVAKESKESAEEGEDGEEGANARVTSIRPRTLVPDPGKAPGAAGTLAKRLIHNGWTVQAWTSLCAVDAVLFVADSEEDAKKPHLAGDVRYEAHELETVVIVGVKRASGHMLALDATWERKLREGKSPTSSFQAATTYDPYLGRQWRTTVTTPRKPHHWEIQEGIPGTPGLEQWLDIIAPKPPAPPKRKTKKTPEQEQETTP